MRLDALEESVCRPALYIYCRLEECAALEVETEEVNVDEHDLHKRMVPWPTSFVSSVGTEWDPRSLRWHPCAWRIHSARLNVRQPMAAQKTLPVRFLHSMQHRRTADCIRCNLGMRPHLRFR